MAQFTYNFISKYRFVDQEAEGIEKVETLRDVLLQQIFANQLKTDINLSRFLENKNKFVSGAKQENSNLFMKGILSNECFKKKQKDLYLKEILFSSGLGEDEIKILLDQQQRPCKESPEAYLQKLKAIAQKLEIRQQGLEENSEEEFSSAVKLDRHAYEEECCRVSSVTAELLTPCLVKLRPYNDPSIPLNHPINKLADLEEELFPSSDVKEPKRCSKKRKLEPDANKCRYYFEKPKSLWDVEEQPIFIASSNSDVNINNSTCSESGNKCAVKSNNISSEPRKTDFSKPFVWQLDPSHLVSRCTISNCKMSIEQIRTNDKFKNYEIGNPSSTLYVKNLPHKIEPVLLVSIFGNFEDNLSDSKIEYRILKGKMRGQAFIRFPNVTKACEALIICNGYVIDGNPIVIEYSRKSSQ